MENAPPNRAACGRSEAARRGTTPPSGSITTQGCCIRSLSFPRTPLTCCSAANTESKQSGRMTLCAASVFVSCNSGLGCVWVRIPAVDVGSAAGGLVRRRSARRSVVERTPVELGCGLGRCGAPEVPENGGEVNRSRLSQRVPVPEGDGARGADRQGRRPALANPRGISRTPSLRGPGWYQGGVVGQQACSGKSPGCAATCSRFSGGVNRSEEESSVGRTARASPATRDEAARSRATALVEPLAGRPQRG
jgi:hypothetical protein